MLFRFELRLKCEKDFTSYNMGSLMHGVLMEKIPAEYACKLHEDGLKPFSQYVLPCDDGMNWTVNCLNDECAEQFDKALMHGDGSIFLKAKNKELDIVSRNMSSVSYRHLIETAYFDEPSRFVCVRFKTPCSFKSGGRYMIFPDMGMMYSNLMRKFDAFSGEYSMYDENMFQSLIEKTAVSSYNLRSSVYHLESVKIPSFAGKITVKNMGPAQLGNLVRLLFAFGEYSGAGVKTALGMGALEREEIKNFAK